MNLKTCTIVPLNQPASFSPFPFGERVGIGALVMNFGLKCLHAFALSCSLLTCCTETIAQQYPPETALVFQAMPTVSFPNYLEPIQDPTFGTTITRISDKQAFGSTNKVVAHMYSKKQPWNSDGSRIILHRWPAPLLDGSTYKFIKFVNVPGEYSEWSNTDPNKIYGIQNPNSWQSVNVNTNTVTTIRTFTEYDEVSFGNWEGHLSNDDKYVAFQCKKGTNNILMVYDIPNNTVVSILNVGSNLNDAIAMSQSGKYVLVWWESDGNARYQGIELYDRNLKFLRQVGQKVLHSDAGYDTNGNEVFVCQDVYNSPNNDKSVYTVRLDNGAVTKVLDGAKMSWPIHLSCRNTKRPGYAYFSEFEETYGVPTKPNYQKVFALKLDGSEKVENYAHVHHSTFIDYEWSPFACPNRDGSKVMFRSDWMAGNVGPVYSYVAEYHPLTTNIEEEISEKASISPNPSNTNFTLKGFDFSKIKIMSIRNSNGTQIAQISHSFESLGTDLKPGVYILSVEYQDNTTSVHKLLKQ